MGEEAVSGEEINEDGGWRIEDGKNIQHRTASVQPPVMRKGRAVKVAGGGLAEPGGHIPPLQGRHFSVLNAEY